MDVERSNILKKTIAVVWGEVYSAVRLACILSMLISLVTCTLTFILFSFKLRICNKDVVSNLSFVINLHYIAN